MRCVFLVISDRNSVKPDKNKLLTMKLSVFPFSKQYPFRSSNTLHAYQDCQRLFMYLLEERHNFAGQLLGSPEALAEQHHLGDQLSIR